MASASVRVPCCVTKMFTINNKRKRRSELELAHMMNNLALIKSSEDFDHDLEPGPKRRCEKTTLFDDHSSPRITDWAQLPQNILVLINSKLNQIGDCERFGSVCKSWRNAYVSNKNKMLRIEHRMKQLIKDSLILEDRPWPRFYIVESPQGELFLIYWFVRLNPDVHYFPGTLMRACRFRVFNLVDLENPESWVETKSLGDLAIFVGENHLICVSTDVEGTQSKCQPNSIYFTGDIFGAYTNRPFSDVAVCNLEDQRVRRCSDVKTDIYEMAHSQTSVRFSPFFAGNWARLLDQLSI